MFGGSFRLGQRYLSLMAQHDLQAFSKYKLARSKVFCNERFPLRVEITLLNTIIHNVLLFYGAICAKIQDIPDSVMHLHRQQDGEALLGYS
jgi:hypothetical protein